MKFKDNTGYSLCLLLWNFGKCIVNVSSVYSAYSAAMGAYSAHNGAVDPAAIAKNADSGHSGGQNS